MRKPGPKFDRDSGYGNADVFYQDCYSQMPCGRENGSVAKLAHTFIEKPYRPEVVFDDVLEVGAGFGLHVPFVRQQYGRYLMTDISEKALESARERTAAVPGADYDIADAQALPYGDNSFDRVIATCVLLHLPAPEQALVQWRRVTRPGGVVTIYVPNEPGLLTRAGRAVTSRRAAVRAGFQGYDLMMAREHINHGWGLEQMVQHVFRHDTLQSKTWPIPRSPLSGRVFTVYHAVIA